MNSYKDLAARMARQEVEIEKARKAEVAVLIGEIVRRKAAYGIAERRWRSRERWKPACELKHLHEPW
ncbi:hypothetical protein GCT13_12135 [Paraburkholderia sp. CNPSo 3157]|uniref:H-NS histone family protein n=1 Tax=Paraburkholderia franconis TaxID=2654983 RepID=A0A7X1N9D4_9BURK|nr:hypothetical protein [Paraburkholderia franconis]MPW17659.1 hypothetical protein [Paraburkholderia franconis]